jgi:hypothetical protein
MSTQPSKFQNLKPGIPKRYLLFVAAMLWTFAGTMLFWRGFSMLFQFPRLLWVKIGGCFTGGIVFYLTMFSKISFKHTQRILTMAVEKPFVLAFFNGRSYLMMALMISMGITLRATGIVPVEYLSLLYVTMGVPLSLSAVRFYYTGINYRKVLSERLPSK